MDAALEQVRSLVEKASDSRGVKPETRLLHDLHLDGDDVFELLENLAKIFRTSFSEMAFTDFFHNESEGLGIHWALSLGLRTNKKPVTAQHLVDVVERGA